MSGMTSFLGNEVEKAINNSNNGADHQLRNIALRGLSIEQQKAINELQVQNTTLTIENKKLKKENESLKRQLSNAEDTAEEYEQLLCKPMLEIAQQNGDFKQTYEKQMEIMADWMVSQKAFKELAIEFGFDDGLQPDEVIKMGLDKEIDVLNNKHDPSHKSNSTDGNVIAPHRDKLIKKYNESKRK